MWLCMWKLTISEEILIWFLDYFNIFALCEQIWNIQILGPLLLKSGSPFYNFWVPLRLWNSATSLAVYCSLCLLFNGASWSYARGICASVNLCQVKWCQCELVRGLANPAWLWISQFLSLRNRIGTEGGFIKLNFYQSQLAWGLWSAF